MYYAVRGELDPIRALERKAPKHTGTHPSVTPELGAAIEDQYREHPGWSYQLHYDNLLVVTKNLLAITTMPAYATVRRFMKHHGFYRRKRRRGKGGDDDPMPRETRSYEVAHVNALWHYDFHEGRRTVVIPSGERKKPYLFGMLDGCSRVCCHAQWYVDPENTETLVHGFSQGMQKRGVPRASLSDRGGAMTAGVGVGRAPSTTFGRLSIAMSDGRRGTVTRPATAPRAGRPFARPLRERCTAHRARARG